MLAGGRLAWSSIKDVPFAHVAVTKREQKNGGLASRQPERLGDISHQSDR